MSNKKRPFPSLKINWSKISEGTPRLIQSLSAACTSFFQRGFSFSISVPSISCLFFFFSSRRRHTRSLRDWSSDVCSSDLGELRAHFIPLVRDLDRLGP